MRCWRCGGDKISSEFCVNCGASQSRIEPVTGTGQALRKIYDDFGRDMVLSDARYITSALSDLVPDSEVLKHSLELVYHVGLGNLYKYQLQNHGKPDESFYAHVKKMIIDEAGLSDKKAEQLISYFDEMIGWDTRGVKPVAKGKKKKTADQQPAAPLAAAPVAVPAQQAAVQPQGYSQMQPPAQTPTYSQMQPPMQGQVQGYSQMQAPVSMPISMYSQNQAAPQSMMSGTAPAPAKKNLKPFIIGGAAALAVIVIIIVIVAIVSNSRIKINLNEFASIEYTGSGTNGQAVFNFDYDSFNRKYEKSLKFTNEGKAAYSGYAPQKAFEKIIREYVDNGVVIKQNVSNGDKVEFEWESKLVDSLNKYFKVKVYKNKLTDTVKGLSTATTVDVFADVYPSFKGASPFASIEIHPGANPYGLEFRVDKSTDLKNGDTITISTNQGSGLEKYLMENYGVRPTADSKTITVSGLPVYARKLEDIPSGLMTTLQQEADTYKNSQFLKDVSNAHVGQVSSTCVGYYFMSVKEGVSAERNNFLIFVYKNVVRVENGLQSDDFTYFSCVYITNVNYAADGKIDMTLCGKNYTGETLTVSFGNKAFRGFDSLLSLKAYYVDRFSDSYDCVDKTDPSKA